MLSKLPVEKEFLLPKEYHAIRVVIQNDDKASFLGFCQGKLGISQDDLTKELEALGIQDKGIHANYATILDDLKSESRLNNAKGNFGEAKTVWYLSKYEGYFIVQAGWENDPFERATGVDCIFRTKLTHPFRGMVTHPFRAKVTHPFRGMVTHPFRGMVTHLIR